nr:sulfite exporter TauE/SafE family protein [uncultured Agathobaculum sp.]
MTVLLSVLAGLATGILSGFGIGGGSLLLLYLTLFADVGQFAAAGINLLYFIACAPAALWSHIKNGLVEGRAAGWCVLAGVATSVAAALLAARMDTDWLRRAFGVFLLYVGAKELLAGRK